MGTYAAIASPDGKYWHIRIPGLGNHPEYGLPTQARNLDEVEPTARDLIAVWLDVPADSFDVDAQVELPDSVRHHLELASKLRQEAADAQAAAAEEYRRAAAELKNGGLTVRDIGKVLGISYQRVHQLVKSH
ncbi:hypothetical protein H7H78_17395 [Mycobacterium shinjukuense]|uniref:MarR family transcriptional regulator n=1 Tax=Mycobacterium shinjukuense TaxID=398694 RepID=UPI000A0B0A8C|nr:helix-turn-helix domain-containing protein [Mycobacterium shinjukuense]MCV6987121.1 hypothetical protein [Mycobacterium shinjukuense]ORB65451.1 hypothetical protein BST45_14910 [Mycobacterium shinjukuense]